MKKHKSVSLLKRWLADLDFQKNVSLTMWILRNCANAIAQNRVDECFIAQWNDFCALLRKNVTQRKQNFAFCCAKVLRKKTLVYANKSG